MNMNNNKQEITKKTGERIRFLRNQKRLSQEELAFNAGINPAYIGHIERGLKCPTIDTLNKICSALEVSLSYFFDFDSENFTSKNVATERIINVTSTFSDEDIISISNIISEISKIKKH